MSSNNEFKFDPQLAEELARKAAHMCGMSLEEFVKANNHTKTYSDIEQDAYERGYNLGYDKGYSDGDFFAKIKTVREIKQFMLETFGGDDGTGNLNKIYEYLYELEIKEQTNE